MFSLTAVVSGSQQTLLLPREKDARSQDDIDNERKRALWIQEKVRGSDPAGISDRYVYALQAPIMLLMFAVMTFLAGLCSVVFSPLARNLGWNGDAKVSRAAQPRGYILNY